MPYIFNHLRSRKAYDQSILTPTTLPALPLLAVMPLFNFKYTPGPDGCEDLEKYRPGGYHPAIIGDEFLDGRYYIVHKLGSGGSAVVWLARDQDKDRLVALKILTAESSQHGRELKTHQYLQEKCDHLDKVPIAPLRDHFRVSGINGEHTCLVFDVLGPNIASLKTFGQEFKVRPETLRVLVSEVVEGLLRLHEEGIALGDITPYNMLFCINGIDSWTDEQVYETFGYPEDDLVTLYRPFNPSTATIEDRIPKPAFDGHAPEAVFLPLEFLPTVTGLVQPMIRFIDLGEAFEIDAPPTSNEVGVNINYSAPELYHNRFPTKEIDIWGLACTIFELRTGRQLFSAGFRGSVGALKDNVATLGPMPNGWMISLIELGVSETMLQYHSGSRASLRQRLRAVGKLKKWHFKTYEQRRQRYGEQQNYRLDPEVFERMISCFNRPPSRFSSTELRSFHNLLSRMLKYHPENRISVAEILVHPWVRKQIKGRKGRAWLVRYDPGRDFAEDSEED